MVVIGYFCIHSFPHTIALRQAKNYVATEGFLRGDERKTAWARKNSRMATQFYASQNDFYLFTNFFPFCTTTPL